MGEGIERFVNREESDGFLARVEFASEHSGLSKLIEQNVREALKDLCFSLRSFADPEKNAAALIPALERKLDVNPIEKIARSRLRLPSGRNARCGMSAASRRPSLRGCRSFSELRKTRALLYPKLRRELERRYPSPSWPEEPL